MRQLHYTIWYDWRQWPSGKYGFHGNYCTDFFIPFLFKFIRLKMKYDIVDVEYRKEEPI